MNNIESTLVDIGVPTKLVGFKYIADGISLGLSDNKYLRGVTKLLYPTIAENNGTTSIRVERGIRHAIERTFKNIEPATVAEYFGNCIKGNLAPTNSEFISLMVLNLKED